MSTLIYKKPEVIERCTHIAASYDHFFGVPLLQKNFFSAAQLAEGLYNAPLAIVSHDNAEDPVFRFGSRMALQLWRMDDDEFIGMPSRHSAEIVEQDERRAFLEEVRKNGFTDNYSGIRISAARERFEIANVRLWNVIDDEGKPIGQAAAFRDWQYL